MSKGGKIEGFNLKITKALATLESQHNKYLANLPIWDQYIVWNYTLGSQPVNRRLVGAPVSSKDSQKWVMAILSNFDYPIQAIGRSFRKYTSLFINPKGFLSHSQEEREYITEDMLDLYSKNLQRIILGAPVTTGDIVVYKASTPYDPKLTGDDFPFALLQAPFNSTTYDPFFDFNAFLGSNKDTCCLWQILIPKGSRVLAIAHAFQAYLTEREILLPYGGILEVTGAEPVQMSYYDKRQRPMLVQEGVLRIGEVYTHDGWEKRSTSTRTIRMLEATFHI